MCIRDGNKLRYTLLPPEIDRYRELGQDAAGAVETTCRATCPGDTELEVAARLAAACRTHNILPLVNLIAGDDSIAQYRHPIPTYRQIQHRVMVVLTGWRHGLHVCLIRLVAFEPLEATLLARHRSVLVVDARLYSRAGPE